MDLPLRLVDWTLKSAVLLVAAGVLTLALRRRSAAVRHLVWVLALGAALGLPALTVVAPSWSAPIGLPWLASTDEPRPERAAYAPVSPLVPSNRAATAPRARVRTGGLSGAATGPLPATLVRLPAQPLLGRVIRAIAAVWRSLLIPLWLVGAGFVLATIALGVRQTRRLRRAARPAAQLAASVVPGLRARLDLRTPVSLLELDGTCMPMTFGEVHPVVLLPAEAARWPEDRIRAVLLHELAHVKRHDYLTQLIARVACAMYWFNPLVWLAARRLRVERELACDDLVLAAGSRASDYASHLLEIARRLKVGALSGVASIAMARPSQLADRLLAVLDGSRARRVVTRKLAASGAVAAVAISLPLAGARTWERERKMADASPREVAEASRVTRASRETTERAALRRDVLSSVAEPRVIVEGQVGRLAATCDWESSDRHGSSSFNVSDDRLTIRISLGRCDLAVDADGEITFSQDEDDVTGLSSGGSFNIRERDGDTERQLDLKPGPSGLERRWLVDRAERPYDAEARAWLARTLVVVFRRTGLDAEHRAQRILARGGVDAVLEELTHIRSDYAARKYFEVLLTRPGLDQATLLRIVRQAGQQIGSDFELTELLVAVAQKQPLEDAVRQAYVEAVGHIGSDYERHRALKAVLGRQGISKELAAAMLESAQQIGSDFELASLLVEIASAHAIDSTLAPAFFQAVSSVSSDYERHRVLSTVVKQARGDRAVLDRSLDAAAGISSDFELAQFLTEVAQQYPLDQPLPATFLVAASKISSGFEHRRALMAVLTRDHLAPVAVASALDAAQGIGADFELAELLVAVAQHYPLDDTLRPAFFRALSGVNADFEHSRVLKTVVTRKPLTEPVVLAVLESAGGIQSDFELAELLIQVAKAYPVNERVRPALMRAAEHIQSEYERGRVLAAIYPRTAPADR